VVDEKKLINSIEVSYRKLRPYRESVFRLVEEYAGPMYGTEGNSSNTFQRQEKYLNLSKQAVSAYMTLLASNRPRVLLSTADKDKKPFARKYQTAVNKLLEEIEIEKTIAQWVRDAFFWIGIVKVHMGDSGEVLDEGDVTADPGMPFASNVALDDFFFDTSAKKWSECRYAGDIYRMPIDTLQNSGLYSGDALDDLAADSSHSSGEFLKELSMGSEPINNEIEPMVDVCDVWLPREGVIRTYIIESRSTLKLKEGHIAEVEWDGKELGPYHLLHFDEVSENIMPCSTAADLQPLERLINNLYRKNARKASRQKDTPIYSPSGEQTARKLRNASDGEWISVTDPRDVNVIKHGGIDGNLHGFMLNSMELFDRMAGNLQAMLGLGPSSDTVGQERLIRSAGSRREGQLQTAVVSATVGLIKDIAMLLWGDSFTEIPASEALEDFPSVTIDMTWKPDNRVGKFKDYKFEIDVYSMQYQTPASRVQAVNELLQSIYIPLMPVIQQQGGNFNLAELTSMHSEMLNLPRLKDIVDFGQVDLQGVAGMPKPQYSKKMDEGSPSAAEGPAAVPDASTWINSSQEQQ
jgi:hypothetical protein